MPEYDAARKIAQGLGAQLDRLRQFVEVKGENARLLFGWRGTRYLFGRDGLLATTARNAKGALYPAGSEEKRWVDGVLARKKGLGF